MEQAEHHQWEVEQQMEFAEYQQKRDQLTGRLLGAVDLLKVADQTWSPGRKNAAIADILYYNEELKKLHNKFWGKK